MQTKVCFCCKEAKPLKSFGGKGAGRVQSYCKPCLYLAQMRRWNKQKVRAVSYLGGVCSKCGSKEHPINFDFHHRDQATKECDWRLLRRRSWDKITKELDKCDLLCVRCHRFAHHDPKMWTW